MNVATALSKYKVTNTARLSREGRLTTVVGQAGPEKGRQGHNTVNAPLPRLFASPQVVRDDRRRERRHLARFEATLKTSQGRRIPVMLTDVSLHGCCVESDADSLRQGTFVSIGLGEEPMLPAIVRWVRGEMAGMEFLHAIPPDRFDWHDLMHAGMEI
mgnify:CR=1 FL=1